jgi:hypothetical protein
MNIINGLQVVAGHNWQDLLALSIFAGNLHPTVTESLPREILLLVPACLYGRRIFRRALELGPVIEVLITAMSIASTLRASFAVACLTALSACSFFQAEYPDKQVGQESNPAWGGLKNDSIFGEGGIVIFGGSSDKNKDNGGAAGIGINAYLWRASLETLSFMPLASADPFGGVIITDWYSPPESPNERFKMSIFITDRELHADGIRVSVFRQVKSGNDWADATLAAKTSLDLENAILTRARELRAANAPIKRS